MIRETNGVSQVRPLYDIQLAHDLIDDLLAGELPFEVAEKDEDKIAAVKECLCWVLSHKSGEGFESKIETIKTRLARLGIIYKQPENLDEATPVKPFKGDRN